MIQLIFNVLIADDDEHMRLLLKKAIERNNAFKVVGEAADGISAASLVESLYPDVIFMDVEMPGVNGLECAKKVFDINPKTCIIFATAHEEYMSDAFKLYAFDYLVKPFNLARISQTLNRIVLLNEQKEELIPQPANHRKEHRKLLIRNKEGITLVDEEDILLIQRENRTTAIYTADERYTTSEGLSELEERLDPNIFFRSHKSYIINLSMVYKIYPYGRWTYLVKLKSTEKDALVTHDKFEAMQKFFK